LSWEKKSKVCIGLIWVLLWVCVILKTDKTLIISTHLGLIVISKYLLCIIWEFQVSIFGKKKNSCKREKFYKLLWIETLQIERDFNKSLICELKVFLKLNIVYISVSRSDFWSALKWIAIFESILMRCIVFIHID